MNASRKGLYWSRYARTYDDGVDYVVGRALREAVALRLSREHHLGNVLECGCGTGFFTKEIAPHADRVMATDISPEMLEAAGQRLAVFGNVEFRQADVHAVPFPGTAFKTVLLANILNNVDDPLAVLRECFRVLRYDGLLIAIVYTDYDMDDADRTNLALRYFQKFGLPPSRGLLNFSPEDLRSLHRQAGFTVRTVTILGESPKAIYLRSVKKLGNGAPLPRHQRVSLH